MQSKVTACVCVMAVLLVVQVVTAQGFNRDGPAKFMRWGKRGDSTDSALGSSLELPLFGNTKIICRYAGEAGLYNCAGVSGAFE
uniref:Luqin n=1 Tax=Ophionotus victoriae TaxID=667017 RepID=A0A220W0B0_9ECHI|nr:luqin precursor [Ophionotus victoriae]